MNSKFIAAESVSAYDAKTHLPNLLQRAEQGERFVITRHGKPVAQLLPIEIDQTQTVQAGLDAARALRTRIAQRAGKKLSIPAESIIDLIHEGHRF